MRYAEFCAINKLTFINILAKGLKAVKHTKKFPWKWILIIVGLLVLAFAVWAGINFYIVEMRHVAKVEYDPNVWFEIAPEGAITAEGEQLSTRMRVGTENKVIVFFFGGGISINEYTAARPYVGEYIDREPGFYSNNTEGQIPDYCELGIGSRQEDNPFRDWSVIVIPYTTGDFHVGNSEFEYTALDGSEQVLYHHGYANYQAIMDEAVRYTGNAPEELIIAGYSAGGYGAAILARDLMENYYDEAGHVTVCVDSSLLILNDWTSVLRDVWNAPEEIVSRVKTQNLVVDFLEDLYNTYGDSVTYLYVGSVRDGALAKYQTYFDTGVYATSNRFISVYTAYLRVMVRELQQKIPTIGIFLFDSLPYSWQPWLSRLTQHTILETTTAYWRITAGRSAIQWLNDAVNGSVQTLGLEKLLPWPYYDNTKK